MNGRDYHGEANPRFLHGAALKGKETVEYRTWKRMKGRCLNPNSPDYPSYGGRGIKVCDRWLTSFQNFYDDMGPRPNGTSIDRINTNGNYEPSNCRWATPKQQGGNTKRVKFFEFNGLRMNYSDWNKKLGVGNSTMNYWIKKGVVEKRVSERLRGEP